MDRFSDFIWNIYDIRDVRKIPKQFVHDQISRMGFLGLFPYLRSTPTPPPLHTRSMIFAEMFKP